MLSFQQGRFACLLHSRSHRSALILSVKQHPFHLRAPSGAFIVKSAYMAFRLTLPGYKLKTNWRRWRWLPQGKCSPVGSRHWAAELSRAIHKSQTCCLTASISACKVATAASNSSRPTCEEFEELGAAAFSVIFDPFIITCGGGTSPSGRGLPVRGRLGRLGWPPLGPSGSSGRAGLR